MQKKQQVLDISGNTSDQFLDKFFQKTKSKKKIIKKELNKSTNNSSFPCITPLHQIMVNLESIHQKFGESIDFKRLTSEMNKISIGDFNDTGQNFNRISSNFKYLNLLKDSRYLQFLLFILYMFNIERISDKDAYKLIEDLLIYSFQLEKKLLYYEKEQKKLEYLNKYLEIGKEKRDEMLQHTLQENMKLKEKIQIYEQWKNSNLVKEKQLQYINNKQNNIGNDMIKPMYSQKKQPKDVKYYAANKTQKGVGYLSYTPKFFPQRSSQFYFNQFSTQTQNSKRNTYFLQTHFLQFKCQMRLPYQAHNQGQVLHNYQQNQKKILLTLIQVLFMTIINKIQGMQEMENIYYENPNVQYINKLLQGEQHFNELIQTLDRQQVSLLYYCLKCFSEDHKQLYNLIYRFKNTIKAANEMYESIYIKEALNKIISQTCIILNCDRASVFVLDKIKKELWTFVAKDVEGVIRIPMNKGIVGYVAETKQILNITDAYQDKRFNQDIDKIQNYKTKTILSMPILDKDNQVIGVIQCINKNSGCFSKDDEGFLFILSKLAGYTLTNSLKFNETIAFHNSLRQILRIGVDLITSNDLHSLLVNAEEKLKQFLTIEQARIFIVNQDENCLKRYMHNQQVQQFPLSCGIAGKVFQKGALSCFIDSCSQLDFNNIIDIDTTLPLIVMPIISNDNRKVGVFEAINPRILEGIQEKSKSPALNAIDQEVLEFFSLQLAQAIIKNQEVQKIISQKDYLLIQRQQ